MSDFTSTTTLSEAGHTIDQAAAITVAGRCHACGCVGPNPGSDAISAIEEITEHMQTLRTGHWELADDRKSIRRSFVCRNFKAAVQYINHVAEVAEREDIQHHPDVHLTNYRNIEIVLFTHAAGGLTLYDFKLARAVDGVYIDYSPKWLKEHPEIEPVSKP